jgi:DNA-binding HxlR family transcriptional regulator
MMRAGARTLTLLSVPMNVDVLTALEAEPRSLIDLRRAVGSPPQTTLRAHLRTLTYLGILENHRHEEFPGGLDLELARTGRELLEVVRALADWLAQAPEGGLRPGSTAAQSATKALVEGWSSAIVRALAARPLSLTELNKIITTVSYPSLERRLTAMCLSGQIRKHDAGGSKRPYSVTDWLRQAVAPIAAAVKWERRAVPEHTVPLGRFDAEAVFLLLGPLVSLDEEFSGLGRLAVEFGNGDAVRFSGVMLEIENGRTVSCVSKLEGTPSISAVGSASAWMDALVGERIDRLHLSGDHETARRLIAGLRDAALVSTT